MVFRLLAGLVAVLHGGFLLYVVFGGFLVWRWPKTVWLHVIAVAWGVGIVAVGWECPLTNLEEWLVTQAGDDLPDGGFVDRYVEDHLYPERFTPWVRTAALCTIVISWYGVVIRHQRRLRARSVARD